mgnify:CR=1 FL=1
MIGVNTATGTLSPASGSAQGDVIAADNRLTVRGSSMVGGIAGINRGTLGGTSINCLTNRAAEVHAAAGSAGGVVGAQAFAVFSDAFRSARRAACFGSESRHAPASLSCGSASILKRPIRCLSSFARSASSSPMTALSSEAAEFSCTTWERLSMLSCIWATASSCCSEA